MSKETLSNKVEDLEEFEAYRRAVRNHIPSDLGEPYEEFLSVAYGNDIVPSYCAHVWAFLQLHSLLADNLMRTRDSILKSFTANEGIVTPDLVTKELSAFHSVNYRLVEKGFTLLEENFVDIV